MRELNLLVLLLFLQATKLTKEQIAGTLVFVQGRQLLVHVTVIFKGKEFCLYKGTQM